MNNIKKPSQDVVWRYTPGCNRSYQISNTGQVRSLPRTIITVTGIRRRMKGRILKTSHAASGYLRVELRRDGENHSYLIHRLVAEFFIQRTKPMENQVGHSNGNKQDNHASNLRWLTHQNFPTKCYRLISR